MLELTSALRRVFPILLCAAYLPAAALPCPTPGLDRSRPLEERSAPAPDPAPTAQAGHDYHDHGAHQEMRSAHADPHAMHGHHEAEPAKTLVESTAKLAPPCPCGCAKAAKTLATGGKLGPVLIAVAPQATIALGIEAFAEGAPRLQPEPTMGLDPVPI